MLSVVFLVFVSVCHAQQLEKDVKKYDAIPIPTPPDLGERSHDDPMYWVQNIPNTNMPDILRGYFDGSQETKLSDIDLKPPEHDSQKVKAILKVLEFLTNSVEEKPKRNPMKSLEFPTSSTLSKVVGNLNLTNKNSIEHSVRHLAKRGFSLRNDTDRLVEQLDLLYLHLASDESDNSVTAENSYKYGMSLILRFLFEFYKIFRKMSSQQTGQLRLTGDVYGASIDKAIVVMKEKKHYTPLQISAPIRRSADIFKSIIYESVSIIQGKCNAFDPNWKCILIYLANLVSETTECSNVWYHALLHMLALEKIGIRDCFVYKIAILDKFRVLSKFENIFDFIMDMIEEYREVGRIQLSAEAVLFSMLADLQENGLLNCISIDHTCN